MESVGLDCPRPEAAARFACGEFAAPALAEGGRRAPCRPGVYRVDVTIWSRYLV